MRKPTLGHAIRTTLAALLGCALTLTGGSSVAARQDDPAFDPAAFAVGLTPVAGGFERPVHVADAGDESGRLFVVEQPGRIQIVRDGVVAPEPFLDIVELVESSGNEQGLLSVAFHPNYPEDGRFFIGYTARDDGANTVASYRVSTDNPDRADPDSAEILLAVEDFAGNHNGGQVAFGPDGFLYAGLGDGGGSGDPEGNGQDLTTLLGTILRLDVDNAAEGEPYAIPADNPFVDDPNARPEIWAWGLRNPWRFSFDRETGDLWIGDVGQNQIEEVDFQPADSAGGENYGWNVFEGTACYADPGCDLTSGDYVPPVVEYSHDFGCSVTGGFVYRGTAVPMLTGVYLYADYCTGLLWGLGQDAGGAWVDSAPIETGLQISSFGEDAAGELYVTAFDGSVYLITGG
jgi:glucose/arabinose dehydrogenase